MKSAKEFINSDDVPEEFGSIKAGTLESFINKIQLDAWKQGMADAAQLVDSWHPFSEKDNVALRSDICNKADIDFKDYYP